MQPAWLPVPDFPPQLCSCTNSCSCTDPPGAAMGQHRSVGFRCDLQTATAASVPSPATPVLQLCKTCLPATGQENAAQPSLEERSENELLSPPNNHLSSSDPRGHRQSLQPSHCSFHGQDLFITAPGSSEAPSTIPGVQSRVCTEMSSQMTHQKPALLR